MQDIKTKILIVDDDNRLRDLLNRYLKEQGFTVSAVADGAALDKALARENFDLLVLDLMLPGEDGLSICRRLRANDNETPILMLTAKGDEVDRIVGLELGADDYLPKPFNPRELVARIKAILRRHPRSLPGVPGNTIVSFARFSLDLAARSLSMNGETTPLTTGEFALLSALVAHPRQPLSRAKLMKLARGRDYEAHDRSIDVQVSRLRRLIEVNPAHPRYIQTVWGFGYVFVPDGGDPA
ncbi:MAG TPA: two-component system response regulator OmpR [Acidiferrobacterales bacterium]|nr:two-component system response regulator OmpR [Acidiferrobacterales bacterium]